MAQLGSFVKKRRKQKGWSRAELARRSGVADTTIRNIEQNPKNVKSEEETLEKLAKALEVENDVLLILAGYKSVAGDPDEAKKRSAVAVLGVSPRLQGDILEMLPRFDDEDQMQVAMLIEAIARSKGYHLPPPAPQ